MWHLIVTSTATFVTFTLLCRHFILLLLFYLCLFTTCSLSLDCWDPIGDQSRNNLSCTKIRQGPSFRFMNSNKTMRVEMAKCLQRFCPNSSVAGNHQGWCGFVAVRLSCEMSYFKMSETFIYSTVGTFANKSRLNYWKHSHMSSSSAH